MNETKSSASPGVSEVENEICMAPAEAKLSFGQIRAKMEKNLAHMPLVQTGRKQTLEAAEGVARVAEWVHAQPGYDVAYHQATRKIRQTVGLKYPCLQPVTPEEWRCVCQYLAYKICLPPRCFQKLLTDAASAGAKDATEEAVTAKKILQAWEKIQGVWHAVRQLALSSPQKNDNTFAECMRRVRQCYDMREAAASTIARDERKYYLPLTVAPAPGLPVPASNIQLADVNCLRVFYLLKDEEELEICVKSEMNSVEGRELLREYRMVRLENEHAKKRRMQEAKRRVEISQIQDSRQRKNAWRKFRRVKKSADSVMRRQLKSSGAFDPVGGFLVHEEMEPFVNGLFNITHLHRVMTPHVKRVGRILQQASVSTKRVYHEMLLEYIHGPTFPPAEWTQAIENFEVSREQVVLFFLNFVISELAAKMQQDNGPELQRLHEEHIARMESRRKREDEEKRRAEMKTSTTPVPTPPPPMAACGSHAEGVLDESEDVVME